MTETAINDCDLCVDDKTLHEMCEQSADGYICTRPKGHEPPHAACGGGEDTHPYLTW